MRLGRCDVASVSIQRQLSVNGAAYKWEKGRIEPNCQRPKALYDKSLVDAIRIERCA